MLKPSQVRYLTEVLGVESVLSGPGAKTAAPRFRQGADDSAFAFIAVSGLGGFETSPERELLNRIIVATKLDPNSYLIVQVADLGEMESIVTANGNRAAIVFLGKQAGTNKKYGECAVHFTHSLAQLLADQSLKKATWNGLQELLKGLDL